MIVGRARELMRGSWIRNRLRKARRPGPIILMYHRVAPVARDPWGLAVSPENFGVQVDLLRQHRDVLPLEEFCDLHGRGRLPRRAVTITFDDGYLDNLENAGPTLAAFDAPATLFLTTGPMRHQHGYWWDVLAAMILDAKPMSAVVRIGSEEVHIDLGPAEPDDGAGDWRAWHPPRTARERTYFRLWSLIGVLLPTEVAAAMDELAKVCPVRTEAADRPMTVEEVRRLLTETPFTLGCHTVDHPDLSALSIDVAREQIIAGKAEVEAITGARSLGFAYPSGRRSDAVEAIVRDAGFQHAFTTQDTPLKGAAPFALPRRAARDEPSIAWLDA